MPPLANHRMNSEGRKECVKAERGQEGFQVLCGFRDVSRRDREGTHVGDGAGTKIQGG
jgi:hypothetical protein